MSNTHVFRCTFIPGCPGSYGERCKDAATVLLLGPDGVAVPGGQHCEAHARLVCEEYREKLGESWSYVPLAAPRGWEVAETSVEPPVQGRQSASGITYFIGHYKNADYRSWHVEWGQPVPAELAQLIADRGVDVRQLCG